MLRTRGITHIAMAVADARRSFEFYRRVFGMAEVYAGPGFIQAQTPGSWDVLVFQEDSEKAGRTGGLLHFGFRLVDPADIEMAAKLVEEAGGTLRSKGEFVPGEPYLFASDPDGYEFEIWFERSTPVDPG